MNRLAGWLIAGATGWLALKSLRAEGELALARTATRLKDGKRPPGHSATPGELAHEVRDRGRAADHPAEFHRAAGRTS